MSQPAFAPAPVRPRSDGWTPARQNAFIEALAETSCVARAAEAVGMSEGSCYRLRNRADAAEFARAWDMAVQVSVRRLTDVAIRRAMEGVEEPVFWKGEQVGVRRRYNDKLLMFVLRHHLPQLYSPQAERPGWTQSPYLSALLDETQARLKEAEARADAAERAVRDAMKRKVEGEGIQSPDRHAEIVSTSTEQQDVSAQVEEWIPDQVRDDVGECGEPASTPSNEEAQDTPPPFSMLYPVLVQALVSYGSCYAEPEDEGPTVTVEETRAHILAMMDEMDAREAMDREEEAAAWGDASPETADGKEGEFTASRAHLPHLSPGGGHHGPRVTPL